MAVAADSLSAISIDDEGKVLKSISSGFSPELGSIEQITEFVEKIKAEFGPQEKIGLAVPGLVDSRTGRVTFSAQIPEHSDLDLVRAVEERSGVKISIINDANAAACAEYRFGAGRESSSIFYAMFGQGVGGAMVFEGKLWTGASGFAGEFGYVAINSEGARIEDFASAANIVLRTRARMLQDDTSSLSSIPEDELKVENIYDAAEAGDDLAQMMLSRTGEYIGTAIASVINLLNPQTVVIGGDLMRAEEYVLGPLRDRAAQLSFKPSFESVNITAGILGKNAITIGAALA